MIEPQRHGLSIVRLCSRGCHGFVPDPFRQRRSTNAQTLSNTLTRQTAAQGQTNRFAFEFRLADMFYSSSPLKPAAAKGPE